MFYSFSIIFIIIIVHHFLISFSNANTSVYDKMLIAFMKGQQEIQISEYSTQKYEALLGILHFMRKNWQCEKIGEKFKHFERTECQKYRKYLGFLYEYLRREYAGIHTVKPKFIFKKEIEIEGPIIYAVNCLVRISQFYFTSYWSYYNKYKLNELFIYKFELKLLNEERLNYLFKFENELPKLPINEMILQLAIDTANECQTNEGLDGIILQRFNNKFEENLEEMFKNAEKKAKEKEDIKLIKNDKHFIIMETKFDDKWNWAEDALFSEFVKGLATNSEKFFKMAKEYLNYLCKLKEYGLSEIEKMHEYLKQQNEAHLGILYLMKKNWHCDKIGKEFKENERTECQKYQKYLEILYEYSFGLYVEAKNPEIIKQLPSLVKPIFLTEKFKNSLIDTVRTLNHNSKCFWKKDENEFKNINLSGVINLVNEKELNYAGNVEKSEENGEKSMIKNENKFNDPVEIANLRREFERELEKICEKTKVNVKEEKVKLEKALANPAIDDFDKRRLKFKYEDIETFLSSPFS